VIEGGIRNNLSAHGILFRGKSINLTLLPQIYPGDFLTEKFFKMNSTLRPILPTDLDQYHALIERNRKRLEDFFAGTVAITKTREETEKHLADVIAKMEKRNYFSFVVVDADSNELIASIQVKSVDWSIPKAELGYYIDSRYEGKGIITKATAEVIAFCFNDLKLEKLYIRTHEGNISSRKVAEKNGFTLEGTIRKDYRTTKGELVDLMYYGLIREDNVTSG
jgi:RimJ/RimL family protein N-acetyltransferase